MNKLAKFLTTKIVPDEYKDNLEQIEVAVYGMEGFLCNTTTIALALIISFLFHTTKELCLFLLFFVPLRSSYKSFHCKTFINCLILSNLTVFVATIIIQNLSYYIGIEFINLILIWANFYLSFERNIILHIILSMIICLVHFISKSYLITIMISLCINTVLLLLKRGENNEKI